jgi:hypothetical protein
MVINKEHLTKQGLDRVRAIKKIININNSLTNKTGSAKPSNYDNLSGPDKDIVQSYSWE